MDRLFDNDWVLRALAIVLSVVLWVQASQYFISIGPASVRSIPVHVVNVPVGFVATAAVRDVEVTVLAPSTLARLVPSDFSATVAPTAQAPGTQSLPVMVDVPRGTRLKTVAPDLVRVRLVRAPTRLRRST